MNDKTESICEQERQLFEDWRLKGDTDFIEDGVVDERCFLQQKCRFVFILKEANQMGQTSLTSFLKNGAPKNGGHTWNPVCRWLVGENSRIFSPEERSRILRKIAIVNVKKEDGGSVTNMTKLKRVVERDREYIKAQLNLYAEFAPVVFICCGPGLLSMIQQYVFNQAVIQRKAPLPFMRPFADREVYFVAFYHPNARQSGLVEKFNSIRTFLPLKV